MTRRISIFALLQVANSPTSNGVMWPADREVGVGCVTVLSVCDLAVHAVLFKIETPPIGQRPGQLFGCANAGTGEKPSVGRHRL